MLYEKLTTFLQGLAAAMGTDKTPSLYSPRANYKAMAERKYHQKQRKAGTKVARLCYQGRATMQHEDGVIAATIREIQMRKFIEAKEKQS